MGSEQRRQPGARFALLTLSVLNALNLFDRVAPNAARQQIIEEFGLTDVQSAIPSALNLASFLVAAQVFGLIVDRGDVDRRCLLAAAAAAWSGATFLCGLSNNFIQLTLFRMLVGAAEAGFACIAYPMVADLYPVRERTAAFAVLTAAIPVGAALGFAVGGLLAARLGWRSSLCICGLPGIVVATLVLRIQVPPRGVNDQPGAVGQADSGPASGGQFANSIGADYLRVLRVPHWRACLAGSVAVSFGQAAASEWYPTFLHRSLGADAGQAGLVLATALLAGGAVGVLAWGQVSQWAAARVPSGQLLVPALCTLPAALLMAVTVSWPGSCVRSAVLLTMVLLLAQAYFSPVTAICMTVVPAELRGQSQALFSIATKLFDVVAPLSVGWLSERFSLGQALHVLWVSLLVGDLFWWYGYLCLPSLPAYGPGEEATPDSSVAGLFFGATDSKSEATSLSKSGASFPGYAAA